MVGFKVDASEVCYRWEKVEAVAVERVGSGHPANHFWDFLFRRVPSDEFCSLFQRNKTDALTMKFFIPRVCSR
jgi:hypothetical protein